MFTRQHKRTEFEQHVAPVVLKKTTIKTAKTNSASGFSLIELLVTIAILGVLVSIAVPNYQQFIIQERRSDAHNLLLINSAKLTSCFTLAGSYENDCRILTTSKSGYYVLTTDITATTWEISAIPVADKAQGKDTECRSLTLNHIGIRSATGDDSIGCWDR